MNSPLCSKKLSICGVAVVLAVAVSSSAQVVNVTILDPTGTKTSQVLGLSSDGQQQVGTVTEFSDLNNDFNNTSPNATVWSGNSSSRVNLAIASGGSYWDNCEVTYSVGGSQGGSYMGYSAGIFFPHAMIWSASGTVRTDLQPSDAAFIGSRLTCAVSTQQGGAVVQKGTAYAHAAIWSGTAASFVDLTPPSVPYNSQWSEVLCTDGITQGGYVYDRAAMWSGKASTYVDLHPGAQYYSSRIMGISGAQQVGWVQSTNISGTTRAGIWNGTAASFVDINPIGYYASKINAISGNHQCGYAALSSTGEVRAGVWTGGSVAGYLDLQKYLPAYYVASSAECIVEVGSTVIVGGWAVNTQMGGRHGEAVIWKILNFAPSTHYHPADTNRDLKITPAEYDAYVSAFASGTSVVAGVGPVPIDYVTRAGFISRQGQSYQVFPSQPPPLEWAP